MKKVDITENMTLYIPQDENDANLLAAAIGATFSETTFPSGWMSPKEDFICLYGVLFSKSQMDALSSLNGHKTLSINTGLANIFGPIANVESLLSGYEKIKGT